MNPARKIPVHVLTGFLGSGKTTLLNAILKDPSFANSAVIINEFGEIGLDHHLVESGDDTIIELSNGCLCCTVRGQLVDTMENLVARKPERILIETTGLADPFPVLQAIIASPGLMDSVTFAGLMTAVDVISGEATIAQHKEAEKQVALADVLILTKLDEPSSSHSESAGENILPVLRRFNPSAKITEKAGFLKDLKPWFDSQYPLPELPQVHDHFHHHHDRNRHDEHISTTLLETEQPVTRQQLEMFLDLLLSAHGDHILRIKGLVQLKSETRPLLVQAVGNRLSEPTYLANWPTEKPSTQLVVFLQDMSETFVQRLFSGFFNEPQIDTPDKAALTDNPLAVAGFSPEKRS